MRTIVIAMALAGLIGGTSPALAQNHNHQDHNRQGGRHRNASHAGGRTGANHQRSHGGTRHARGHHRLIVVPPRGDREHHDAPAMRRSNQMHRLQNRRPPRLRPRSGHVEHRRPRSHGGHIAHGRRPGPRYDFSGVRNYHRNFRARRRFHGPRYHRPRRYYAHHWVWGEFLPQFFWAREYWLIDYWRYGLPPPPFDAVWVRVGDDALLIDRFSGEIVEVEYGLFF